MPLVRDRPDRLFPPHPRLADLIHCPLVKTLPGGRYTLPATLQPIFVLVLRGRIWVEEADGLAEIAAASLSGGSGRPCRAVSTPGSRALMVSVRTGRLGELVGLPAGAVAGQLVPLAALLPAGFSGELDACLEASERPAAQVAAFQRILLRLRAQAGAKPDTLALALPPDWLARPLGELAAGCGIGIRQFERRFAAGYGFSLRAYRQQQRCSRTLTHWLGGGAPGNWAAVAMAAGYADQAHLSRDVLRFTGHSPAELQRRLAAGDPAMWPYRFGSGELGEMFDSAGY